MCSIIIRKSRGYTITSNPGLVQNQSKRFQFHFQMLE
eukprot:14332.XXX_4422_4532_1 [CDS] Oithona nana genome sequencing.